MFSSTNPGYTPQVRPRGTATQHGTVYHLKKMISGWKSLAKDCFFFVPLAFMAGQELMGPSDVQGERVEYYIVEEDSRLVLKHPSRNTQTPCAHLQEEGSQRDRPRRCLRPW